MLQIHCPAERKGHNSRISPKTCRSSPENIRSGCPSCGSAPKMPESGMTVNYSASFKLVTVNGSTAESKMDLRIVGIHGECPSAACWRAKPLQEFGL